MQGHGAGTGESHLLIGLGIAAAEAGRRVRYVTCASLVDELAEAADERVLSKVLARSGRLDLLHGGRWRWAPPPAGPSWWMRTGDPLSAHRDFWCPSAGTLVSAYREFELSVVTGAT